MNPVADRILGGWQLSTVFLDQTGTFVSPSWSGSDLTNNRTTSGRPDCIGNWRLSNPTISQWFSAAAFILPPAGTYGNCAKNIIQGPGQTTVDMGILKSVRLGEKSRFQLRATAVDAFNHPIFGNPRAAITSPASVGTITSTVGARGNFNAASRHIELGARIDF